MTLKKVSLFIAFILLLIILLISIFIVVYDNKKRPKLPQVRAGEIHKVHSITGSSVRLLVLGDMGKNGEPQRKVSQAMEQRCKAFKPDAMVFLGDNIYPDGVESINDPQWQTNLLQFYQGECLKDVAIYAVLGNHDYIGSAQAQIDYTNVDSRWNMPFRNYDVQFGDILSLTVIDAWYLNYCRKRDDCSINFLSRSLKTNRHLPWRLAAAHYPVRSASTQSSNHAGGLRGFIMDRMLCAKGVTTYLAGHAHHLEHSVSNVCNMDLIVSGAGGGSSLYTVKEVLSENEFFAKSDYGFAEISASKAQIQYTFFDTSNTQLYTFKRLAQPK